MTRRVHIASGWSVALDGDMTGVLDEALAEMIEDSDVSGLMAVPVVFEGGERTVRIIVYSMPGAGLSGADLAGAAGEVLSGHRDSDAVVVVDSSWHEPGDDGWLLTGRGGADDTTAVVLAGSTRAEDEGWARELLASLRHSARITAGAPRS